MVEHQAKTAYAGMTVKIKDVPNVAPMVSSVLGEGAKIPLGQSIKVEDWWDRVSGRTFSLDNAPSIAEAVYAFRCGLQQMSPDNEVLYGHTDDGAGHIFHVTEIE